jgi:CubicO group peptidase (beta-lactamase class C family)
MTDIHGRCDDRFTAVRDAFASNFDRGLDVGASVAVVHEGEMVVDLWGGLADPATGRPWDEHTITNVWSTTKTMMALTAMLLADRGELDVDAPVARYWPEFAQNGKDGVLVRHILSHTAGLSGWAEPMAPDDLYDWERCCDVLARQAPWWEPGTQSGYHAITQGYLVGEVVRRIAGATLGELFAKEIAGPLGADFHIGLDPAHYARISNVIPPPPLLPPEGLDPASVMIRTLANPPLDATQSWQDAWRRAEIPAANGHGNARSVARVQSVVSHGGEADGVRVLSSAMLERIFDVQCDGTDLVLAVPLRHGIGWGLPSEAVPLPPDRRVCFWGGWGGSIVINDVDAHLTVAYMMNRMGEGTVGDERGAGVVLAAYVAAGVLG